MHAVIRRFRSVLAVLALMSASWPVLAGIPAAFSPLVIEPVVSGDRREFDLTPAIARARAQHRNLYVYLGATDCPYCRRYEAFLTQNAQELAPRFAARYMVVDLRSELSVTAAKMFIRVGDQVQSYGDFQRSIGDERARLLVYPSVWLLDTALHPLMQMPAGTGTFQTVPEQIEILDLVN